MNIVYVYFHHHPRQRAVSSASVETKKVIKDECKSRACSAIDDLLKSSLPEGGLTDTSIPTLTVLVEKLKNIFELVSGIHEDRTNLAEIQPLIEKTLDRLSALIKTMIHNIERGSDSENNLKLLLYLCSNENFEMFVNCIPPGEDGSRFPGLVLYSSGSGRESMSLCRKLLTTSCEITNDWGHYKLFSRPRKQWTLSRYLDERGTVSRSHRQASATALEKLIFHPNRGAAYADILSRKRRGLIKTRGKKLGCGVDLLNAGILHAPADIRP